MNKFYKTFHLIFYAWIAAVSPAFSAETSLTNRGDFGVIEMISCTDNLRTQSPTYLGLEITPAEDWIIQDVDLHLSTSQDTPMDWFIPFKQPFHDRLIYPISAVLTQKPTEAITFTASGFMTACKHDNCTQIPFTLHKTLGTDIE